MILIDFHTHALFSDGECVPGELVHRAAVTDYRVRGAVREAKAHSQGRGISGRPHGPAIRGSTGQEG